MHHQKTIAESVSVKGRGLFIGEPVTLTFKPAEPDTGIVFIRTDTPEKTRIPAQISALSPQPRRTTLRNGTVGVETIEHCLASVYALEIDNLEIELDAAELPNIDGSCDPYTEAIMKVGTVEQDKERQPDNSVPTF